MILPDVNVLVYAFRTDATLHHVYRPWLLSLLESDQPFAISRQVLASVIRIVTNPRTFTNPEPLSTAIRFTERILVQSNCHVVEPGPRHWAIFTGLCLTTKAKGNLVQDAWLAAIAIEHGCEWITEDRDFARFPGLRWSSIAGNR